MTSKVIILAILVLVVAAVVLRLRRVAGLAPREPDGGTAYGPFTAYGEKIREFASADAYDYFFVVCKAPETERFVQMSAGRTGDGAWIYQFSFPVFDWSRPFVEPFRALVASRGLDISQDDPDFLVVDFASRDAHLDFARAVMTEVLGHDPAEEFEITWG